MASIFVLFSTTYASYFDGSISKPYMHLLTAQQKVPFVTCSTISDDKRTRLPSLLSHGLHNAHFITPAILLCILQRRNEELFHSFKSFLFHPALRFPKTDAFPQSNYWVTLAFRFLIATILRHSSYSTTINQTPNLIVERTRKNLGCHGFLTKEPMMRTCGIDFIREKMLTISEIHMD